ncbi:MAG: AEC family transporter [Thermodesulfobacteriota bacterium]
MHVFYSLVNAIVVIVLIYGLAILLKRKGTLVEDHSLVLARIVTDLCLPAMIFVTLAKLTIVAHELIPAFIMLGLELSCIAVAWLVSVLLKFARPQQGAIVFCSAFGSSAFLGYALIMQVYPNNPEVLGQTVLISEIGVGYPIFILGPMLAAYFGSSRSRIASQWKASLAFFKSPVFFALLAGIIWSGIGLPGEENVLMAPIFQLGHVLASALTPIAILSVGLMFKIPDARSIFIPLIIVIAIKLIAKPLLAGFISVNFSLPGIWEQILILLSAMPPAVLGVVFLKRYGGDARLASALLLAGSLISCATIIGVFRVLI